jgi:hypothetical protein
MSSAEPLSHPSQSQIENRKGGNMWQCKATLHGTQYLLLTLGGKRLKVADQTEGIQSWSIGEHQIQAWKGFGADPMKTEWK